MIKNNLSTAFNLLLIGVILAGAFACGLLLSLGQRRLVDFSVLENYNPGKASILLDDAGQPWAKFEIDRRSFVALSQIPPNLIQAFLAAEDHNFFQHCGISWRGICRSLLVNLKKGRIVQGASTITQQLVKLLFFDARRTFSRKLKEQFVSLLVEKQFTKEQILEVYLNHVYFGCGIYGVEAAARRFFGKGVQELDLKESATLAGVVKSPGQYCPLLCPLSAQERRNLILHSMRKRNLISAVEYAAAVESDLGLSLNSEPEIAPHLKEHLRKFLETQFGRQQLYRGGLVVQTTLNRKVQEVAEQQFCKQFQKLRDELGDDVDGALLTINSKTGDIKALVGGVDFKNSQYDRALQARRQMGSIFKPIVYAAALLQGASFSDVEVDEPFTVKFGGQDWSPRNSNRNFEGSMTLARALSFSNNVITVKTLLRTGAENVAKLAENFNLPGPISPYPSLALGCIDVTLQEALAAFNVFANNGVYVTPFCVKWVKNGFGSKIWRNQASSKRVLPSQVADQVAQVLGIGAQRFLSRIGNHNLKTAAIGKTGTTNDSTNCWFAGATPGLSTALYLGRDNNRSLGNGIFPIWTLFPIWLGLHERVTEPGGEFIYNPALRPLKINWRTGMPSFRNHDDAIEILI